MAQQNYWRLKTVDEYESGAMQVRSKETRKYIFNCLDDILRVSNLSWPVYNIILRSFLIIFKYLDLDKPAV